LYHSKSPPTEEVEKNSVSIAWLIVKKNSESNKGMEFKTGQYLKLGRVCFKVKETNQSAKDYSNVNFVRSENDLKSNSQNTDAYISDDENEEKNRKPKIFI